MDAITRIAQQAVPDRIGRYRIEALVGQGATSVVYRALDTDRRRTVALKIGCGSPLYEWGKAELVARLKNEALVSGRLAHPNIVAVHEYGEFDGTAYIVMELVEGTSLASVLTPAQPTDVTWVMRWMTQLLGALAHAHASGVVHRDIKPSNLLVTTGGDLKITDFGIAWIEPSTVTPSGLLTGTPSYMSPEQIRGDALDGRSDLFSVAIVLYQLLTGTRPFSGDAAAVMHQILHDDVLSPSRRNALLGRSFDPILATALAKNPIDRFATAGVFLDALTQAFPGAHHANTVSRSNGADVAPADSDDTLPDYLGRATSVAHPVRNSHRTMLEGASLSSSSDLPCQLNPESFAELDAALSRQLGPAASALLEKVCAIAGDTEELQALLIAHIPSEAGKSELYEKIEALKQRGLLSTTGKTRDLSRQFTFPASAAKTGHSFTSGNETFISPEFASAVEKVLTTYIGVHAKAAVESALVKSTGKNSFVALISESILSAQDKDHFFEKINYL